ncbi:MAG: glycosyltransferase family 2 protein [Candidatus Omnitrophica bacterium]|nr:glycosyltransferase family 2 protein [Candidatus Omnitrophota bacterium]
MISEVAVLIPAYQEAGSIFEVVTSCRLLGFDVLVVDDGSSDDTSERAQRAGAIVFRHPYNQGKGAAIQTAITHGLRQSYSQFVFMDADGQHVPDEVDLFLTEQRRSSCDMIIGNRMLNPYGMPFIRRLTNSVMSFLISLIIRQKIPDTQCGYRLVSRRVLESITLTSSNYEIESEMLLKAGSRHFTIGSVPIRSVYRREKSNIRPLEDTVRFCMFIIRFLLTEKRRSKDGTRS